MPRRNNHRRMPKTRAYFTLRAPEASEVVLCGSFNGWDTRSRSLRRNREGIWATYLVLRPGIYEYRFLVDGRWHNDPGAATVGNPYGTQNSVKVVV